MDGGVEEAKRILEETIKLAQRLYGGRWMDMVEELEDMYDGDPWAVLDHLRREAARRGLSTP